jgi:hypothetical protein
MHKDIAFFCAVILAVAIGAFAGAAAAIMCSGRSGRADGATAPRRRADRGETFPGSGPLRRWANFILGALW